MLTLSNIESSFSLSRPVELYLFEHGARRFAFTSGSKKYLHVDGLVYEPLDISRGNITRTSDENKSSLGVTVPGDSAIPEIFRTGLPRDHVSLRIFRANLYSVEQFNFIDRDDIDTTAQFVNVFAGEVVQVRWNNTTAELTCAPVTALQRRQMLRMGYQSQCNNHVYDELCTLKLADWQESVTVTEILENGFKIKVSGKSQADAYYKAGIISRQSSDFRSITNISGDTLTLISPFDALKVGESLELAKGCNGSAESCQSFNNFDNFFGCLNIPTDNPFR